MKREVNAVEKRLEQARGREAHWKRWGPYLSERAWGIVREDYSAYGTAWDYLPHDHARRLNLNSELIEALGTVYESTTDLPVTES